MKICMIGTGYVGLVSGACFAEMGNFVTCVDVDAQVIAALNAGNIPIYEPGLEGMVQRCCEQGRLHFSTDLAEGLEGASMAFICVGTPCDNQGACDLQYVEQVATAIGSTMEKELVIVDKSTVPVGTADMVRELVSTALKERGKNIAFDVVSNPEFLKEGDAVSDFMKPDRVIVGTDCARSEELLRTLYAPFARTRDKIIRMSVRSAEMTKYAANCLLATKISFINEVALLCEKVGADVRDVRMGIGSDHRIGHHFIYPGAGYGGSCFPKDVKALIATARRQGHEPELLASVESVNERQKRVLAQKIEAWFADKGGVQGKKLALWGLAFKANTDDIREASSLAIIRYLTSAGMQVCAFDPAAADRAKTVLADNERVEIKEDQYAVLAGADVLAVITEWNQFRNPDFMRIKKELHYPAIFDGRNLYQPAEMNKQGFFYYGIGRAV